MNKEIKKSTDIDPKKNDEKTAYIVAFIAASVLGVKGLAPESTFSGIIAGLLVANLAVFFFSWFIAGFFFEKNKDKWVNAFMWTAIITSSLLFLGTTL